MKNIVGVQYFDIIKKSSGLYFDFICFVLFVGRAGESPYSDIPLFSKLKTLYLDIRTIFINLKSPSVNTFILTGFLKMIIHITTVQ